MMLNSVRRGVKSVRHGVIPGVRNGCENLQAGVIGCEDGSVVGGWVVYGIKWPEMAPV